MASAEPSMPDDRPVREAPYGDDTHASWVPPTVRGASEWSWRLLVIAAGVVAVMWVLATLSTVTIPVAIAILLAAMLAPLTLALNRIMPRPLAAFITVIGTLAVVLGLISLVGTQLATQITDLTSQVVIGLQQIRDWLAGTFGISDTQISDFLRNTRQEATNLVTSDVATQFGLTAGHIVTGFFISMFTLFFFLMQGEHIWAWVVRLFPRGARTRMLSSGRIAWHQLTSYTRATIIVAAVDAVGIGAGAAILGVPFAAGIGLLTFFGAFVPIIGALASGAIAVILALVTKGFVTALIMLAVTIGVQQLESHLLQPVLMGRAVAVHPLGVLLAIAAGGVLAGIVGALLAVPVAAVINAVGHHLLADEQLEEVEHAVESGSDLDDDEETRTGLA
ncbi:AI-2E family transporter [Kribbia dieselivorans]|uniref:AI-2E family transporter n=1 Tax=Kribbia dieselivorans TaxID=331526 RepID=UPI000B2B22DE|nr:AI-2E family transporter [Kribbia dieselivorans]